MLDGFFLFNLFVSLTLNLGEFVSEKVSAFAGGYGGWLKMSTE
jgi:hypothetical protein